MRKTLFAIVTISLLLAGACRQEQTTTAEGASPSVTAPHTMSPEELGELGARIRKQPERANELLGQHGMNQESFEQAIRKVTENPDDSRKYAEAYKRASS